MCARRLKEPTAPGPFRVRNGPRPYGALEFERSHSRRWHNGSVLRGQRLRVLATAVAFLLGAACSNDSTVATSPVPTVKGDGFHQLAGLDGLRLAGDADRECVWAEAANGTRIAIVWPKGFRAAFDPVRLIDGEGDVVASEGDLLGLGGGWNAPQAEDRCGLTGGTRTFVASNAERAG